MKAAVFSDLHLEAGSALGWPDATYGNSRLRDAEGVLEQIVATDADVLIFAGDVGRTSRLTPTAYRILQRQLGRFDGQIYLMTGNHDYAGASEDTSLHVLAESLHTIPCIDRPKVVTIADTIQIGFMPWAPPARLFDQAKHNPRQLHQLVAARLLDVARGLAQGLDPALPSLLVVHWLVSSTALASGTSVIEAQEPILHIDELESSGPWDVIACGHNHTRQKAGERTYVIGPPMRSSFGEQDLETGFLLMEDREAKWVDTVDRSMLTVEVDLAGGAPYLAQAEPDIDVKDAIVRLRAHGTEAEVKGFDAPALVKVLYGNGAHKVVGPQIEVERTVQRRSELTTEMAPEAALSQWLAQREGLEDSMRSRTYAHGLSIISG